MLDVGYNRGGVADTKWWTLEIRLGRTHQKEDFKGRTFFEAREAACIKYNVSRDAVTSLGYMEI